MEEKKNPTQVSRYKVKNKQFVINLTIALLLIFKPQDTLNKIWGWGEPNQVIWWFTAHVRANAHRSQGREEKSGRWQSKQQGALLPTVPSSRVSRVPSTVNVRVKRAKSNARPSLVALTHEVGYGRPPVLPLHRARGRET